MDALVWEMPVALVHNHGGFAQIARNQHMANVNELCRRYLFYQSRLKHPDIKIIGTKIAAQGN
jgi:hypothetical protein